MKVEQIYTGCIAHAAYYIESNGEAAVFDPLREVNPYIERAEKDNAQIKYVFETHFHADFVSGHLDLRERTGAQIVFGPTAQPGYDALIAKDEQVFELGDYKIKVIHTPGHTMESTTYLLIDQDGKEHGIITGDTLFIGDVGRPDLAAKSNLTKEDLAGHLYDSLHNRIMPLSDDIIVYPAHGAGSACGKNMSSQTSDTLGNQKETNYAFKLSKADFIKELITGLQAPPSYFPENVAMNKRVNIDFDTIIKRGTTPLSVEEFETIASQDDVLILDTRAIFAFAKASLPHAWFIGLSGQFAPWVGSVVQDINQKIIFIAEEGKEEEVATRLSRVGYDHSLGYLKGGVEAWVAAGKETVAIQEVTAQEFVDGITNGSITNPLDVRKPGEYATSHIDGVSHASLDEVHTNSKNLDPSKTYHIHCAGGYRSLIYASIARSQGIDNVVNVLGGYGAIKKTELGQLK
ncbi:MBL fold metallo-hydrolase, partial [Nonlabens ulvanivorans]|uniref:MBL fold metallo-hydrolase n=1 Tax=Nonlabens ulvanivorans TaxID=906888 RepID=UPI003265D97E